MAVTSVVGLPEVSKIGGATEERNDYTVGVAYAAGDLIRIVTLTGTISPAVLVDAGAVHGLALEAGVVGEVAKILLFADDTVVSIPCEDTVAPEDLKKGTSYDLDGGTGAWGVASSTAGPVATIVGYAGDGQPWDDAYSSFDEDPAVDNNRVMVRFKQTVLDANVA